MGPWEWNHVFHYQLHSVEALLSALHCPSCWRVCPQLDETTLIVVTLAFQSDPTAPGFPPLLLFSTHHTGQSLA